MYHDSWLCKLEVWVGWSNSKQIDLTILAAFLVQKPDLNVHKFTYTRLFSRQTHLLSAFLSLKHYSFSLSSTVSKSLTQTREISKTFTATRTDMPRVNSTHPTSPI
ncbi:hypothetical protein VNO77_20998 [Canavalia gladiata]|uniref:Uncharacterized protein n=1 Tax=Canavalia gladiata TaxID=3824 RepID=A0AAN9QMZ6_CANGL